MIRFLRYLWTAAAPWLRGYNLRRRFWLFFTAALCWDAGFGLYFFLFNLYLLDFHLNERAIGLINGALSLGVVSGTLPAGILTRRFGARRLLLLCFLVAPILGVLRAIFVWEPAAIALAFIAGVVMCIWTVCFLPVTASLTSESNRAAATGLIFSVGIGATAGGAAASGYLSRWVVMLGSGHRASRCQAHRSPAVQRSRCLRPDPVDAFTRGAHCAACNQLRSASSWLCYGIRFCAAFFPAWHCGAACSARLRHSHRCILRNSGTSRCPTWD